MPDKDWTIIVILGIGWGSAFFFNEILLREMGPVSVSFARVGTAALFCWLWVFLSGRAAWPGRERLVPLAVLGALMFAIPFAIYPLGQQFVASGVAGIVNALTPVMVVIVSHFWPGGEKATMLKMLGVLAGFAGIVLLTLPAMAASDQTKLFGTVVLVLAPICYAFALNFARRLETLDSAIMVAWSLSFAAAMLLPVVLALEGVPPSLSAVTWVSTAFLGCVLTGASFLVAFRILPRAGPTKTSTVTFIAPISALLLGYLVLREALSPLHFGGMAAIFLGLLLIDGRLIARWLGARALADGGAGPPRS
ncbi:MAG: DMT family transporter [Pseudomonadota bacterium]